jgi:hypothetical protein
MRRRRQQCLILSLPDSLKYKFLGPTNSLPVIIASDLIDAQEEELLDVLREHKEAID